MEHNQELCGRYLVSLLAAVLGEKQPGEKPAALSFGEIFQMAKAHQVSVMAIAALERLAEKPEPVLLEEWQKERRICSEINIAQMLEQNRLLNQFAQNGIRAVPLKGCVLKFLYPRTEYRQMGDLDILIEEKDAEHARTMMGSLGYRTDSFDVNHHDRYSLGSYLIVELHRMLFITESPFFPTFKDLWANVIPDVASTGGYRLSLEDFYLHMITHFEKHFHNFGSGLRSIMDIAVYLDAYSDSLNWTYIDSQLDDIELRAFHKAAQQLASAWFRGGLIGEAARRMEHNLLDSGGVYGSRQKYLDNVAFRLKSTTKCNYIFRLLFLPLRNMQILYPMLYKWPCLYPIFLLYRLITKRRIGMEELQYIMREPIVKSIK